MKSEVQEGIRKFSSVSPQQGKQNFVLPSTQTFITFYNKYMLIIIHVLSKFAPGEYGGQPCQHGYH